MANANQVIVNGETILDLRSDTVIPETLQKGYTAHDKSGAQITGTLEVPAAEERTVELSMPSGNQVIQPTSGKVMSKVTVQKPATLLPENIKKDVVIGGVTGTLEAGGGGGQSQNIISFKKVISDKMISLTHDDLVAAGLDTVDKYYAVKMISLINVRHAKGVVSSFLFMDRTGPQGFVSEFSVSRCTISGDNTDSGIGVPAYRGYYLNGQLPYQFKCGVDPGIPNTYMNEIYVVTLYLE